MDYVYGIAIIAVTLYAVWKIFLSSFIQVQFRKPDLRFSQDWINKHVNHKNDSTT